MVARKFDVTYAILTITIFISLGFIFLLARENGELRGKLSTAYAAGASGGGEETDAGGYISGPPELQVGDLLHPFQGNDLSGKPVAVKYNGERKYFFYLFSAFCGTCMSQLGPWNGLSMNAKTAGYQPIGISLENPGKKVDSLQILSASSTLMVMPDIALQRTFRATSIPMLAVVDSHGKVEWVHYGALNEKKINEFTEKIQSVK